MINNIINNFKIKKLKKELATANAMVRKWAGKNIVLYRRYVSRRDALILKLKDLDNGVLK